MTTEEIQKLIAETLAKSLEENNKAWEEKLKTLQKTDPDPNANKTLAELQLAENAKLKAEQDAINFKASKIATYTLLKEKHGADSATIFNSMDSLLSTGSRDEKAMQDFLSNVDALETELLKVRMSKEDITEPIKARYENGSIRDFKALEFELAEEAKRKQAEEERNKQNDIKNGLNNINKLLPAVEFAKFTPAQKHTYVATIANNNYFDKLNNQLRPKTA